MRARIWGIVVGSALVASPLAASADDPGRPPPVCDVGLIVPEAKSVPANIPAFFLAAPSPPAVTLEAIANGRRTPQPLDVVPRASGGYSLVPQGLVSGGSYAFEYTRTCDGLPGTAGLTFVVTEAQPLPVEVGTITVSELRAANFGAPGPEHRTYYADLSIRLAPSMTAWSEVYRWGMIIDGVRPPGTAGTFSDLVANRWRVFVACGAYAEGGENIVPPGQHKSYQLLSRATAFDAPEAVSNVVEASFDCERAVRVDPITQQPLPPDEADDQAATGRDGGGCSLVRHETVRDRQDALISAALGLLLVAAQRRRQVRRAPIR